MRQHLNKLEIHRFTNIQTDLLTDRHLAMYTLITFWTVKDDQDSIQDSQNNQQDSQDNQDSHQVIEEMEISKQEMELFL